MQHIDDRELIKRLADATKHVEVGQRYKHYHQGQYIIKEITLAEETLEILVIYQNIENGLVWARPLKDWLAKVRLPDGHKVSRFRKI